MDFPPSTSEQSTAVLHRTTHSIPKKAIGARGSYIFLEDGQKFLDSTGGAAVSCVGHGDERVKSAINSQMDQLSYCHSAFFGTTIFEELARFLVDSTSGLMSKAFIVSSGTFKNHHRKFLQMILLLNQRHDSRLRSNGGCHEIS